MKYENKVGYIFVGAYVPLTAEGNIMVDGVLASCYANFDHDLAHVVMTPMHWFPEIIEWTFGKGYQGYTLIVRDLGRWLTP